MVKRTKAKKGQSDGIDWIAIEGQYRANLLSIRGIARQHDISEGGIRNRAILYKWARDPSGTKREIVRAALAGDDSNEAPSQNNNFNLREDKPAQPPRHQMVQIQVPVSKTQPVRNGHASTATLIAEAALEDIRDMRAGLHNARRILEVATQYLDTQFEIDPSTNRMVDPRYLKSVADASAAAIDQIRKIRDLDSKIPDELEALKLLVNAGWMPDELLTAAFQEYRAFKPSMRGVFQQHFKAVMTASVSEDSVTDDEG